jgi:hypothetical protein
MPTVWPAVHHRHYQTEHARTVCMICSPRQRRSDGSIR